MFFDPGMTTVFAVIGVLYALAVMECELARIGAFT